MNSLNTIENNSTRNRPGSKEPYNPLHYAALDIYDAQERLAGEREEALRAALEPVLITYEQKQKVLNAESSKALVAVVQDVRDNAHQTGMGKTELDAVLQGALLAQKEREEQARKILEEQTVELGNVVKLQTQDIITQARAHAARYGVEGIDPRTIEAIRAARAEARARNLRGARGLESAGVKKFPHPVILRRQRGFSMILISGN